MSYLHSMDVVHGDLKSSNVLLKAAALTSWDTRGFVAKVGDVFCYFIYSIIIGVYLIIIKSKKSIIKSKSEEIHC